MIVKPYAKKITHLEAVKVQPKNKSYNNDIIMKRVKRITDQLQMINTYVEKTIAVTVILSQKNM